MLASPSSFAPLSYTPYENRGRLSPSEFNKLKRYERKKESFYVLIRFSRGKASRVNYPPLRSVLNDIYIYIYPLQGCKVLNGENYGCTCVCVCVWKRSSIIVHLDFFSKLSKLWNVIKGVVVVNKLEIWIFLITFLREDQEESIWIKIYEHCTKINV